MIVSTTLTHNCQHIIRDALLSVVNWVDLCLVIDTGVTDHTLAIARDVAGVKYREVRHQWSDFSVGRNLALQAAADLGGSWAITLDTDERIIGGSDLRGEILRATEDVLLIPAAQGNYSKERIFRLPARGRWVGPTHEAYGGISGFRRRTIEWASFTEVPKIAQDYGDKFRRDIRALRPYIEMYPKEPRWYFYLGESHLGLREYELAVEAYDACAALKGWNEESAWACFRAAECLCALDRPEEALERLALGLSLHSGIAELAWYAGFICYQLGRDTQAIYWANLAIVHGMFRGDGATIPRVSFRNLTGLWEGPYDVLRWAERRRGNEKAALEAENLWQEALEARLGARA
jgi:tetratricopeptide (TPR) repeat protein